MSQEGKVLLPDDLSIGGLESMLGEVRSALSEKDSLVINCAGVDRVDTAGIQFLLAVVLGFRRSGKAVVLDSPTEHLIETASCLGLESALFN